MGDVPDGPTVHFISKTITMASPRARARSSMQGVGEPRHGPMTFQRLTCGVAELHHSHPTIPLQLENKTQRGGWGSAPGLPLTIDVSGSPVVSPGSTTATRSHSSRRTKQNGVAGAECPRVATLAIDVSEAHLWCRRAPPQPPDPTPAGEQNTTGWLGQNAPGLPLAIDVSEAHLWCRRAPPQPPDPTPAGEQNTTGWLGQNAPGLQRWPLTCRSGGWGRMPRNMGL